MSTNDFPTRDDLGYPYPSHGGAFAQITKTLTEPGYEPWYSFEEIRVSTDKRTSLLGLRAISYDEDGEPSLTYDFWWA